MKKLYEFEKEKEIDFHWIVESFREALGIALEANK